MVRRHLTPVFRFGEPLTIALGWPCNRGAKPTRAFGSQHSLRNRSIYESVYAHDLAPLGSGWWWDLSAAVVGRKNDRHPRVPQVSQSQRARPDAVFISRLNASR